MPGLARLGERLVGDLTQAGFRTVPVEAVGEAPASTTAPVSPTVDLYLGYSPPPDFQTWPLTATRFVPVVSFWLPVTEVTYADLERIFRGEVGNWAELGSVEPEAVVPLALQTDPLAPLQPLSGTVLPDADALVAELERSPGGIALIPLEQVDVRMRALQVDGYDPLLEETARPGDPLVRFRYLALSPQASAGLARWAATFAQEVQAAPVEPAIEVVVVGDVVPGRTVERKILEYGGDYTSPFALVGAELRRADLTIANLEGVISDEITPPSDPTTFFFVASGRFRDGLRYAGVDGVSLGNNHSMNFGAEGLSDTLRLLDEVGIAHFGAGMDLTAARRPALFTVKGVTFAFLSYDGISYELYGAGEDWAGTAPADPALFAADIAAARQQADVVIPYFHWGWEYTVDPSPWQSDVAHQAVDAGADLVLGGHPHWVQAFERYHGVPILYSPGNFVFDQMWSTETRRGVIWRLIFRGSRLVNIRLQAVQIEDYYQPYLMPAAEAEEVYWMIRAASPAWPHKEGAEP